MPKFGRYNATEEPWDRYIDRLSMYFEANDITDPAQKRATLIAEVGPTTYALFCKVLFPSKPTECTFQEINDAMKKHLQPTTSIIIERYKFNTRHRQPGESIEAFVAELRGLAEHCNYGDGLDSMLRDRFVCGLRDDRLTKSLLTQGDKLTFAKAVELAHAWQQAEDHAKDMTTSSRGASVHKVNTRGQPRTHKQKQHEVRCFRCGQTTHNAQDCWAKDKKFARDKASGNTRSGGGTHYVKEHAQGENQMSENNTGSSDKSVGDRGTSGSESPESAGAYGMYQLRTPGHVSAPLMVTMCINNTDIVMEVDTGSGYSIISESKYNDKLGGGVTVPLLDSDYTLYTYTGESLPILGKAMVEVNHNDQMIVLPLYVVKGDGPTLLGREWLHMLQLDWKQILRVNNLNTSDPCESVMSQHTSLFQDDLGTLQGHKVHIAVDSGAQPRFCKARPVPFAYKTKVEAELDRLESDGVLKNVTFSQWAAPIVPVIKENGDIRICGDFKVTVNPVALPDKYPLPRVEELFAKVSGGTLFTKLDLSNAYQQLELDDQSSELCTINTHKGLYRYTRLPYGISTAPSLFQRVMDSLLADIPHACCFLDDVLVTGTTDEEHFNNLYKVMSRLENAGLRLRRDKCVFFAPEVTYLGYRINAEGLQPTDKKVQAIIAAPAPTSVSELKSFLGLVNYYGKFLPNLSTVLAPLHKLLRKDCPWTWGTAQQAAFETCKQKLVSADLLVHFELDKQLVVSCDASPYGVGAVLAHRELDGSERPIAYASRTLTPAERNYSQLDREGLAVVFAVKYFHQYLYGRQFHITTDHKPLLGLFGEHRQIPYMASSRLQRWCLTLSAYQYKLEYRPGSANANADAFSRLPLPGNENDRTPEPGDYVLLFNALESTAVNCDKIRHWTHRDPVLAQVKQFIMQGWPHTCPDSQIQPYFNRQSELSMHDGCIMWGSRVVIPPQGRKYMLEELHDTHPGISRMKSLARSYVWWPQIDKDLESTVQKCHNCQVNRKSPPVANLHPWEWPQEPWSRVHIDFAGPFMGHNFLIIVDAHSKWLDVQIMKSTTSQATIDTLRRVFATHGLPQTIVSDNGTAFTSVEFAEFLSRNGIKHVRSAPFHPASNGLAERAVQTFKEAMKKMTDNCSIETKIARFLLKYRITPHTTTGQSPSELLMKRKIRSHLDLVRPDLTKRVQDKQCGQAKHHNKSAHDRTFQIGDMVFARNYARGPQWFPGRVQAKLGPVCYNVVLSDGRVWKRHIDQIRKKYTDDSDTPLPTSDVEFDIPNGILIPEGEEIGNDQPVVEQPVVRENRPIEPNQEPAPRRSNRQIKPPVRYGFD